MFERSQSAPAKVITEPQRPMQAVKWTVGRKLVSGFTIVALLMGAVAGASFILTSVMADRFEKVSEDAMVEIVVLGQIQALSAEFLSETREYLLFGNKLTLMEMEVATKRLDEALEAYKVVGQGLEGREEEESEGVLTARIQAAWEDIKAESAELTALYDEGMGKEELQVARNELEEAEITLEAILEQALENQEKEIEEVTEAVRTLTASARILLAVFSITVMILTVGTGYLLGRSIIRPIRSLEQTARRVEAGDLGQAARVYTKDEIGVLAQAFNSMTARLRETIQSLEQRTRDLARRTRYLEATARVARDAASVLDSQELLSQVVTLISERFGFYHTGVFLLDETGEYAVLHAASSEGGQKMLARGYQLKVSEVGIVGYVTRTGDPRIALDAGADTAFFDNPDLPETRSEMALPLRVRDEIIGALDVQSVEPEAFAGEDLAVLQTLADQVAMAIGNARLFRQVQESLEAERRAYGELSRQAWRELLRVRPDLGFLRDRRGISPAGDLRRPEMEIALRTGEATPGDGDATTLAMPVKVRGRVIGVIDARKPGDAGEWTPEETILMETLTEQLGVALESARLYQDTQRRAARERLTGEITDKMRRVTDIDDLMQIAVQEMATALGTSSAFVQWVVPSEPAGDGGKDTDIKG